LPIDGPALRKRHIETFESIVRRVFPLISCESRTHVQQTVEAVINDAATYAYEPALVHADLDSRNVLGNPETGELAAVIDFGDAEIANPLTDYAETWNTLSHYGAADQLDDLLKGTGLEREAVQRHATFSELWWAVNDILWGLNGGDEDMVKTGIQHLNEVVPFETRC